MDLSFLGLVQRHASEMESAFRSLVDTIVRNSKLSISLLRISNVTEDSFHASLEARITKTGLASAGITPMTVDLCGPSGHFGYVTLPAITTQAYGTDVVVASQLVEIVDKEALKAFVRGIIQDGGVVLSLRNGKTSISALGIGPRDVVYEKELGLPGMRGPVVSVQAAGLIQDSTSASTSTAAKEALAPTTSAAPDDSAAPLQRSYTAASISSMTGLDGVRNVAITFQVANPSPMEISFGTCFFDVLDHEGNLVAELKGHLDIRRDSFETTFQGRVNKAAAASLAAAMREVGGSKDDRREGETKGGRVPEARLVGRRCVGAGWCDETIKGIDVPLRNVRRLFHALGIDAGVEEPEEKRASFGGWARGLMSR